MKKEQSDRTVELIREHLGDMGLKLPLKKMKEIEVINDFFEDMEIEMSNALSCGEDADRALLNDVSRAFDETVFYEIDDYVDLDELNRRLKE